MTPLNNAFRSTGLPSLSTNRNLLNSGSECWYCAGGGSFFLSVPGFKAGFNALVPPLDEFVGVMAEEEKGERLVETEPKVGVASAESELGLKDTVRLATGVLINAEGWPEVSSTFEASILMMMTTATRSPFDSTTAESDRIYVDQLEEE